MSEDAPQMPPELPPPAPEEIVTLEIVEKIVKAYNEDNDLVDYSAELGTKMGDNYMSIIYAVEINMKNRKSGEEEKIKVMLKTMPRNPIRQQMINDSGAFEKDAKMYMEVIPKMTKFQKNKGLKELFEGWPKCHTTFIDGSNDYLAMEDLRVDGFKMANRMTGLDIEHTELVLKNIARFHALSFAMYGGSQEKIMELYPWLEEKMFPPLEKVQDQMKMWFSEAMKNEAIIIRKEGFDKEALLVEQICDKDGNFFVYMNAMLSADGMKNAVISHGDCWTNNMLFSYDQDNKLKTLKFLDFQLSRCAPRCIDLAYFLHSSIPIPNLNAKEEDFLRIYLDEFKRFLKTLGTDPEDYELTWEDFMEEYMECKYYGVTMGLMLAPMLSAESKDVPDMENIKESDLTEEGAKDFLTQLMGPSAASTRKICNLAVNHLPRCRQAN